MTCATSSARPLHESRGLACRDARCERRLRRMDAVMDMCRPSVLAGLTGVPGGLFVVAAIVLTFQYHDASSWFFGGLGAIFLVHAALTATARRRSD
jgi:hypothetical protein